jgi:hypothetical protein
MGAFTGSNSIGDIAYFKDEICFTVIILRTHLPTVL